MFVVIGSGPAGVTSAEALVARGQPVTLLDAGVALEPERRARVQRLAAAAPSDWAAEDVAALRETSVLFAAVLGTVLLKERFGLQRALGTVVVVGGVMALRLG